MTLLCSVLVMYNTFGCVLVSWFKVFMSCFRRCLQTSEVPICPVISVSPPPLAIFPPFLISTPTPYGDFHYLSSGGMSPEAWPNLGLLYSKFILMWVYSAHRRLLNFHLHCGFIPLLFSPSTLRILDALLHCARDLTQDLGILGKGSTTEFEL